MGLELTFEVKQGLADFLFFHVIQSMCKEGFISKLCSRPSQRGIQEGGPSCWDSGWGGILKSLSIMTQGHWLWGHENIHTGSHLMRYGYVKGCRRVLQTFGEVLVRERRRKVLKRDCV